MDLQATPTLTRAYAAPKLLILGSVERMTMGNNGSSLDGQGTFDQLGMGNNPACPSSGPCDPTPGNP